MLLTTIQVNEEGQDEDNGKGWLRRTTEKFLAIGAGLEAFLRYTDKIVFSKEPCREPDRQFIDELVELMKKKS